MATFQSQARPILTPCTGVCRIGANGWCEGCQRSLEEIAGWASYSDEQRRYLMNEVLPRRGGPAPA